MKTPLLIPSFFSLALVACTTLEAPKNEAKSSDSSISKDSIFFTDSNHFYLKNSSAYISSSSSDSYFLKLSPSAVCLDTLDPSIDSNFKKELTEKRGWKNPFTFSKDSVKLALYLTESIPRVYSYDKTDFILCFSD